MHRPWTSRLTVTAIGLLLIGPVVAIPTDAASAPALPPNMPSVYCWDENFPTSVRMIDEITGPKLQDLTEPTPPVKIFGDLATTFQTLLAQGRPPTFIAKQLKEQSRYWAKAAKAASKNKTRSTLLTEKRLTAEMTKLQNWRTASEAYCAAPTTDNVATHDHD